MYYSTITFIIVFSLNHVYDEWFETCIYIENSILLYFSRSLSFSSSFKEKMSGFGSDWIWNGFLKLRLAKLIITNHFMKIIIKKSLFNKFLEIIKHAYYLFILQLLRYWAIKKLIHTIFLLFVLVNLKFKLKNAEFMEFENFLHLIDSKKIP